jgi:hypothetical protein
LWREYPSTGIGFGIEAVLIPIRDVALIKAGHEAHVLEFKTSGDLRQQTEAQAFSIGGFLYYLWNDYAAVFGMSLISL